MRLWEDFNEHVGVSAETGGPRQKDQTLKKNYICVCALRTLTRGFRSSGEVDDGKRREE